MSIRFLAFLALLIGGGVALAQDDDLPDAQDLAEASAKRFPQPVRVGDLLNRLVLERSKASQSSVVCTSW